MTLCPSRTSTNAYDAFDPSTRRRRNWSSRSSFARRLCVGGFCGGAALSFHAGGVRKPYAQIGSFVPCACTYAVATVTAVRIAATRPARRFTAWLYTLGARGSIEDVCSDRAAEDSMKRTFVLGAIIAIGALSMATS